MCVCVYARAYGNSYWCPCGHSFGCSTSPRLSDGAIIMIITAMAVSMTLVVRTINDGGCGNTHSAFFALMAVAHAFPADFWNKSSSHFHRYASFGRCGALAKDLRL